MSAVFVPQKRLNIFKATSRFRERMHSPFLNAPVKIKRNRLEFTPNRRKPQKFAAPSLVPD